MKKEKEASKINFELYDSYIALEPVPIKRSGIELSIEQEEEIRKNKSAEESLPNKVVAIDETSEVIKERGIKVGSYVIVSNQGTNMMDVVVLDRKDKKNTMFLILPAHGILCRIKDDSKYEEKYAEIRKHNDAIEAERQSKGMVGGANKSKIILQ